MDTCVVLPRLPPLKEWSLHNSRGGSSLPFLKPHDQTLTAFESLTAPIFDLVRNLTLRNKALRQTRDLLLPKLISGELSVETLDTELAAVEA